MLQNVMQNRDVFNRRSPHGYYHGPRCRGIGEDSHLLSWPSQRRAKVAGATGQCKYRGARIRPGGKNNRPPDLMAFSRSVRIFGTGTNTGTHVFCVYRKTRLPSTELVSKPEALPQRPQVHERANNQVPSHNIIKCVFSIFWRRERDSNPR